MKNGFAGDAPRLDGAVPAPLGTPALRSTAELLDAATRQLRHSWPAVTIIAEQAGFRVLRLSDGDWTIPYVLDVRVLRGECRATAAEDIPNGLRAYLAPPQ